MSCSLCRLPFTPHPTSTDPYPPPPGVLSDKQYRYLTYGVIIGPHLPTVVMKVKWLDQGLFGGFTVAIAVVKWESYGGTAMAFHTVCASILRHIFDCEDESVASLVRLSEIQYILGRPSPGIDGGRFPHVKYEDVGDEKLDVRPYWYFEEGGDLMRFDYLTFKQDGLDWALAKPDVFPRFRNTVPPSRFPGPAPETPHDILTKQSLDILHVLLPYLPNASFVLLLSTCRTFRHAALTIYQSHARERVLALRWSIPLHGEYAATPESVREQGIMVNPDSPSFDGDWLFYLSSVHKSQSLRARRRLWAIGEEIFRAVAEHRVGSEYDYVVSPDGQEQVPKSKTKKALEDSLADPVAVQLREMILSDRNNFRL